MMPIWGIIGVFRGRRARGVRIVLLALAFGSAAAAEEPRIPTREDKALAEVRGVIVTALPDMVSFAITLSRPATYRLQFEEETGSIRLDVEKAVLPRGKGGPLDTGDARIGEAVLGEFLSTVRLVVRPSVEADFRAYALATPPRIVLVIVERKAAGFEAAERKPDFWERLRFSGYAENASAARLSGGLTKSRDMLFLSGAGDLASNLSFKVSGRAFYDAAFALTDRYPAAVKDDLAFEADLRDAYFDYSAGAWDVRAGKQTIVWGEAVGLFYADVVNAKDLREFVLPDFEFIRIPQWGVDLERTGENHHLEFVWLPAPVMNKIGIPGSEFAPYVPLPEGIPVVVDPERKPGAAIGDGEFGARFSLLAGGWDASVFGLRTWDKFPVYRRTVDPVAPLVLFSPEHPRMTLGGLTVGKEAAGVVWKAEAVFFAGRRFSVTTLADDDGLVSKDVLDALIGADHTFAKKWDVNIQLARRQIFGWEEGIAGEKEGRTTASLRVATGFRDNTIEPEILIISDLGEPDILISPKIVFQRGDNWKFNVGVNVFAGHADGVFGQYDKRDRIFAEARYNF
ncbi:MAG: DUF1302 family protein [Planctomycetota bacterium]